MYFEDNSNAYLNGYGEVMVNLGNEEVSMDELGELFAAATELGISSDSAFDMLIHPNLWYEE